MKIEEEIKSLLSKNGPLSSKNITSLLSNKLNQSKNNIKVSIHRNRYKISNLGIKISNTTFKHNEHIFYLKDNHDQLEKKIVKDYGWSPAGRILKALFINSFLFSSEYYKISGRTSSSQKGHKSVNSYINELVKDNILEVVNEGEVRQYIKFNENLNKKFHITIDKNELEKRRSLLSFQYSLVADIILKFRKMGIISWNMAKFYNPLKDNINDFTFKNTFFDAFGFCFLNGISSINNKKEKVPVPLVINSIIYRTVNDFDIKSFEEATDNLNFSYNKKVIRVLVYGKPLGKKLFKKAKYLGILLISADDILNGSLEHLLEIVQNKDLSIEKLEEISAKNIGFSNNVKADLFNYSIALYLRHINFQNVSINKKYKDNKKERECDIVVLDVENEICLLFELKAYKNSKIKLGKNKDSPDSVKKFFESTAVLVSIKTYYKVIPIFISSSGFEDDAINFMDKRKKDLRILKNSYSDDHKLFPQKNHYDGKELLKSIKNFKALKLMLKRYFINK